MTANEEIETPEETEDEDTSTEVTMTPRELAGAIGRAKAVFVYVCWGPGEFGEGHYQISKEGAREIVAHAKEAGLDITAQWDGRDLLIGPCDEEGEEPAEDPDPDE